MIDFDTLLSIGQSTEQSFYRLMNAYGARDIKHYCVNDQVHWRGENNYHIEIKTTKYDNGYFIINTRNWNNRDNDYRLNGLFRIDNSEWIVWHKAETDLCWMVRKEDLIYAVLKLAQDNEQPFSWLEWRDWSKEYSNKYLKLCDIDGVCHIKDADAKWHNLGIKVYHSDDIQAMITAGILRNKDVEA